MTGEPFDDFPRLDAIAPAPTPVGGWLSLWQPRHTVATVALLPGLFAINLMISGWTMGALAVAVIALVSAAQAVVTASFLPQKAMDSIVTCGMIPPVTLFAASALLSELPVDATFGLLALALACTGVAFRFFATTCSP